MKLLITGCSGLLGGRLAVFFSNKTDASLVLASRNPDSIPNKLPNAEYVKVTWDDEDKLRELCRGVDAIIHLAGMNAGDCSKASEAELNQDVEQTRSLLNAAIEAKVERFIYMSTAHVYSSKLEGVIDERSPTLNTHPYAVNHIRKENLIRNAHEQGDIEGVVVRLSNAFGAPVDKGANCWMLLVNDLCSQIAKSRSLSLRSSGKQRRDFVPIKDVCNAVEHILLASSSTLGVGIFNVGGKFAPTIHEMACLISDRYFEMTGIRVDIQIPDVVSAEREDKSIGFLYSIDKLEGIGFEIGGSSFRNEEIDSLIEFCRS